MDRTHEVEGSNPFGSTSLVMLAMATDERGCLKMEEFRKPNSDSQILRGEKVAAAPIVLIVDDNRQARIMYEELLTGCGCQVLTASNAEQALIKLTENEVDLVILDYRLPDVNGLHVLQSIRKKNSALPVIMVTAVDDSKIAKEALSEGATSYLSKPVQRADFLASVQNALEQYTHREPPPLS